MSILDRLPLADIFQAIVIARSILQDKVIFALEPTVMIANMHATLAAHAHDGYYVRRRKRGWGRD